MNAVQTPRQPGRDDPLLELMVQADPRGQVAATVPVRWCVGKPMLDAVREAGFTHPYVVLVVRHRDERLEYGVSYREWQDTGIYAVPLTQEMTFVSFRRPGRNDIRAFVVDMNKGVAKWLRQRRHEMPSSGSMFFEESNQLRWPYNDIGWVIATTARTRVIVPAEMFAPAPPKWLENLVVAFFEEKGADQCGFRRRAIFMITLGWFMSLMMYALKLVVAGLYLFFGRVPNKGFWRMAANPINYWSWQKALDGSSESVWWHGPTWGDLPFGPFSFVNPPVLLALPSLLFGIEHLPFRNRITHNQVHNYAIGRMSWTQMVEWVDGALVGAVVGILLLVVLVIVILMLAKWVGGNFPKFAKSPLIKPLVALGKRLDASFSNYSKSVSEKEQVRRQREQLDLEAALAAMTCRSEALEVSVAALPEEKQSVRLRFNDFKTRVCKPFAT